MFSKPLYGKLCAKRRNYFRRSLLLLFFVIFRIPRLIRITTAATVSASQSVLSCIIRRSVRNRIRRVAYRPRRIPAKAYASKTVCSVVRRVRTCRCRAVVATAGITTAAVVTAPIPRITGITATARTHTEIATAISTHKLGITKKQIPKTVVITAAITGIAATATRTATVPITSITHNSISILLVYLRKISYYNICKQPTVCYGRLFFYIINILFPFDCSRRFRC